MTLRARNALIHLVAAAVVWNALLWAWPPTVTGLLVNAISISRAPDRMAARTKEQTLKDDLRTMRKAIDQYTVDRERAPASLDDLVSAGYLHEIPLDPFT